MGAWPTMTVATAVAMERKLGHNPTRTHLMGTEVNMGPTVPRLITTRPTPGRLLVFGRCAVVPSDEASHIACVGSLQAVRRATSSRWPILARPTSIWTVPWLPSRRWPRTLTSRQMARTDESTALWRFYASSSGLTSSTSSSSRRVFGPWPGSRRGTSRSSAPCRWKLFRKQRRCQRRNCLQPPGLSQGWILQMPKRFPGLRSLLYGCSWSSRLCR
mmetsp:Transcript_18681/g.35044  ORF Transcript_18681/g.35044 Transcript_18681/m.35044 type:complete len:216 (-) Transcript_18681:167-814(-)